MSYTTNVVSNYQTAEYGKFIQFSPDDTRYPAVSVTRLQYLDSTLFPPGCSFPPVSSVDVYPKYAILVHDTSTDQVNSLPFGDNGSIDAFGRLRVSNPITLIDAKLLYGKSPTLFDEVINGTATSVQSAEDACVYMRTLANNDYVIRQTRQRFNYQPGKSIQAFMTGTFGTQTNITKRVGLFSSGTTAPYAPTDGIYLENNSGRISLNVLKTTGTVNTESIPQSAWNVDKMDGTGPSKINLDLSKTNIFALDYEWLGVGRVRTGFVVDGKTYYAHYFNHANSLSAAYMTSPNHHVRYEIRQTGAGSGQMQHICCSVMTEGGEENVGSPFSVDSGGTITLYDTTLRPLLGVRKNMNYKNLVMELREIDIINTNNANGQFGIYLNPTIGGGTLTYSNSSNGVEYAYGNSGYTMSGGTLLIQGFIQKDNSTGFIEVKNKCSSLGESINGTPDTIVIGVKTFSGNGTFGCLANLLERG